MRQGFGADVAQRFQQFAKAFGARQERVDNHEGPRITKQPQSTAQRLGRADGLLIGWWHALWSGHTTSIPYFLYKYILDKRNFLVYIYFRNESNTTRGTIDSACSLSQAQRI